MILNPPATRSFVLIRIETMREKSKYGLLGLRVHKENDNLVKKIETQFCDTNVSNALVVTYSTTNSMEGLEWHSYDVNRNTNVSNAWVVTYSTTNSMEGLEWHSYIS